MKLRPRESRRVQPHSADILSAEPAPELVFDPDRDVTEEDWARMKEKMNFFRGNDWANFFRYPTPLLLLAPERRAELQLDDEVWEGLRNSLTHTHSFDRDFIDLAVVFPERRAELPLDELWENGLNELHKNWAPEHKHYYQVQAVANLLLLNPKRKDEIIIPFHFSDIQKVISSADKWNAYSIPDFIFYSKLLFPSESFGAMEASIEKSQLLLKELAKLRREGRYVGFPDNLEDLLLMTAEKVWLTPEGELKIQKPTLRKSPVGQTKLPERPDV